jgi:hypothetical protein
VFMLARRPESSVERPADVRLFSIITKRREREVSAMWRMMPLGARSFLKRVVYRRA